jgi:hypothetical protein
MGKKLTPHMKCTVGLQIKYPHFDEGTDYLRMLVGGP